MDKTSLYRQAGTLEERLAAGDTATEAWLPMAPRWRNADMYTTRRPTSTLPLSLMTAYRLAHDGHDPDAVTDTPARRRKASLPTLERIQWLAAKYPSTPLKCLTISLPHLNHLGLYSPPLAKKAHCYVRKLLKAIGVHGTWNVERGRDGGIHVHIVLPLSAGAVLPAGAHAKDVYDLQGLADYLCKPADARACRPDADAVKLWTTAELKAMHDAAVEAWLEAGQHLSPGKRRPHLVGFNLPKDRTL